MRKILLIALLLTLSHVAAAQYVRLAGDPRGTALYFNTDRLWSYNLYEQSRWGAGLRLTAHPSGRADRWTAVDVYGGYGYRDRQWKWGAKVSSNIERTTMYIGIGRDYERAASRMTEAYSVTDISSLSAFMTRRLTDRVAATAGYSYKGRTTMGLEASVWSGRRLFDGTGLLYLTEGDSLPAENGAELRLTVTHGGLTAEARVGRSWPEAKTIARLLAQYDGSYSWRVAKVSLWLQGGAAAPGTPYTRLFDLGGTWDAPLLFDHSLLTIPPNTFTATLFAIGSVRVATARPLWRAWWPTLQIGSNAVPFVQLTAAWGHLWGQDGDGMLLYEGLPLQAPHRGVAETAAGIEGLLRLGVVDWGAAVAWRLAPWRDDLYNGLPKRTPMLLLTAKVIF